ncbi:porin [Rhodoferax sp.]|uniref:porin n=1 Tax=Rhodoferax sp. TaxID=50421 RepID=UPI00272FAF0C|nr:porin [Rhodoferax sp.]MDP2443005.1 porin [Rhodoferax sp.]MDZ4206530.1 porin [Rhodoferax sp.]
MNKHSSSNGTVLGLRHVALASALCCAGLAQAQTDSSVTLYGLADVGITSVSGLKAGTVTQVASGIMEGSRWGIKGTEDMGGGYKTIFTLEARVELDTGASSNRPITGSQLSDRFSQAALLGLPSDVALGLPVGTVQGTVNSIDAALAAQYGVNVNNAVFDRQAFVGLITPVGAVLAGRQYTPAYETFGTYDIMATQSALSAGQIVQFPAVFEIRTSNALSYRIVKDGLSGAFMYAPGEVAGDAGKGRLYGINAGYKTDVFSVGLGYNTRNNELGEKSLTSTVLGASMNMGSSKISTLVAKIKDDNPNGLSTISNLIAPAGSLAPIVAFGNLVESKFVEAFKQDGTLFHIGYRNVIGPHTISVAYNRYDDKRPANADVKSYGAAYTYALSKRTDLNAVLVRFDNSANAQVAPGGNGYLGGVTASAGTDSTGVAFGIRHRF